MKSKTLRTLIPILVLLIAGIGFAGSNGVGDLSAFGWGDISLICPVGALLTMLASKTLIPRALISLVVVIVLILVFGRAFCGWVCPVPVVSKLHDLFAPQKSKQAKGEKGDAAAAEASEAVAEPAADVAETLVEAQAADDSTQKAVPADSGKKATTAPLSERERKMLAGCSSSCAERHGKVDGRHMVLGASLLSAAIFGFPVFCLVCPVGLSFATVFLLMRAFGFGDVSWALIIAPVLLILEVTVFRKWCHAFCPISAFMSLVGLGNKTFLPSIDDGKCLETSRGRSCGRCSAVCEMGIDPRHPSEGNGMNECTRCLACVDACPTKALKISALPNKGAAANGEACEKASEGQ